MRLICSYRDFYANRDWDLPIIAAHCVQELFSFHTDGRRDRWRNLEM